MGEKINSESLVKDVIKNYRQLLIDNKLDPQHYEPEIIFDGDKIIITAVPCQIINGVKTKLRRVSDDEEHFLMHGKLPGE